MSSSLMPWLLLAGYGVVLFAVAPRARDAGGFFAGRDATGRAPNLGYLAGSMFIAWIFAKSVTNAANLGAVFGMPGAVAYASYWLAIPIGGLVIVALRRRHGATSLAEWLTGRYGRAAAGTFMLAILIRLYNEVWSNSAVVATYFGERGSTAYFLGAFAFTAVTLAYTLKGGFRTSIWTDALQAGVFGVFLVLVLGITLPHATGGHAERVVTAGSWTLTGGVDLMLVALLQVFSYPFHDPVLTDRGFLADPRTTIKAFLIAGGFGFLAILLFGTIGVTAFLAGTPIHDDAPRVVAAAVGAGVLLMVNVVMLNSAASTVDSTFSSVAKAVTIDLGTLRQRSGHASVTTGRWAMVAVAVLGNLPLFAGATILQATTISGTMVLGLAPIFILGLFIEAPPLSFHLAFWTGIALGTLDALGGVPARFGIGHGSYSLLLGVNAWGLLLASLLFLLPVAARRLTGRQPIR